MAKAKRDLTTEELRRLAAKHPERGLNDENTFTVRDASGHRIDPTTREKVPRGYDIATADYAAGQIAPFAAKLDRRTKKGGA